MTKFPGAMPQAKDDRAPWALTETMFVGHYSVPFDSTGDVGRTLLRENLKLNFEQRAQKHLRALQMVEELRRPGKKLRQKSNGR